MGLFNSVKELLINILNEEFIQGIISNPIDKSGVLKIKVRPVMLRNELYFQLESFTKTQAFHENLTKDEAISKIDEYMQSFRQMQALTSSMNYTVLVSKKGKVTINGKKQKECVKAVPKSHNKEKNYIIKEGTSVPYLQDLGVMTADGKIVHSHFDKFKQINRFLEFIEDIIPQLDKTRELTILDFGCGKSYLTFAMYHYLHDMKKFDINVIGLDLKEDVINKCNKLADKYGYEKLKFLTGDIADYEGVNKVDMVVTLHACNTATDYALAKAVGWDAKVILSVPCCQHELNGQIHADKLAPLMDFGLIKERFASLATDGLRGKYLQAAGYDTQLMEFIDMEHTPKNILIRAVKTGNKDEKALRDIEEFKEFLHAEPTLGKLLKEEGMI